MLKVENWKKKLRRLGFEGSIAAWPEPFGSDLSIEAIPDDGEMQPVQVIFRQGNDLPACDLLRGFGVALRDVLRECQAQVLDARDVREARAALAEGGFVPFEQVKRELGL